MLLAIGAGVACGTLLASYLARRGAALAATAEKIEPPRSLGNSQQASFFWGPDVFMVSAMGPVFAVSTVATVLPVALTTLSGPITSLDMCRGPVLVTLLWIWGFFNAVSHQVKVKLGGGDEQASRVAERSLYNTLEQGVLFLPLLWMTAACVDSAMATSLGLAYSVVRMFYPIAYTYYGGFSMACEMITQPNYAVLHTMIAALVRFGLGGGSLFAIPGLGQAFYLWAPIIFVCHLLFLFVGWDYPIGAAAGKLNLAWNTAKPKKV